MNATTQQESLVLDMDLEPKVDAPLAPLQQQAMATLPAANQAVFTRSEAFILELLARGVKSDQIASVMDLRDRQDAKVQEQEMTKAMAGFKSEAIEIVKRKHVKFKTDKGWTEYDHAELADVIEAVTPHLSKYGLSVTWKPTKQAGDWIEVTCWVKHDLGGSDQATLGAAPDKTGGKNNIQAIGSTCTYLSRYLTLLLLGLAAKGQDNDGRGNAPADQAATDAAPERAASDDFYPAADFERNFEAWTRYIQSGRKTADEIVMTVKAKKPFSPDQEQQIRAIQCAA